MSEPVEILNESPLANQTHKFTDDLIVKSLGVKWQLVEAFRFYYLKGNIRIDIIIPENFITDFASTPTWAYPFFPPVGIYNKAAIMHDYLYDKNCSYQYITRRQADLFFLQAMQVLGTPKLQRILMYVAVRLAGSSRFRKKSYLDS